MLMKTHKKFLWKQNAAQDFILQILAEGFPLRKVAYGEIVPVNPGGLSVPLIIFPLLKKAYQNAKLISSCKEIILNLLQLIEKLISIDSSAIVLMTCW